MILKNNNHGKEKSGIKSKSKRVEFFFWGYNDWRLSTHRRLMGRVILNGILEPKNATLKSFGWFG